MAGRTLRIWYDSQGDYLEVTFDQTSGFFQETSDERVMKKVDGLGIILGFSILGVRALEGKPLEIEL
jgi:hypothetical protein